MLKICSGVFIVIFFLSCSSKDSGSVNNSLMSANEEEYIHSEVVTPKTPLESYLDSLGLIDIQMHDSTIKVELKYATTDNFTHTVLYRDLNKGYLHPLAIDKLSKAQSLLKEINPDYSLLVYDAVRPLSVQKEMYDAVKNTKYNKYVADPSRTSLHNYGMAVDVTICDGKGNPLDMGTEFDHFGKLAGIYDEEKFLSQGLLSQQQINNRRLLRNVMQTAGFMTIRGEWWHFNASSLTEAKKSAFLIK